MTDNNSKAATLYVIEDNIPMPTAQSGRELHLVPVNTDSIQVANRGKFTPGQSGNLRGRPKGSRNRISELFAIAMRDDFATYGHDAIARLRERDPASYLHLVHSMIPQAALIKCEEQSDKVDFDKMTDIEFVEFMEETEGGNDSPAIAKMRREQAVSLVLSGKASTIRQAMILLGADL